MADNYAHGYNARKALAISGYQPRNTDAFILGSNGPDPMFFYQMYNPLRRYHLSKLGTLMHNERTGLFLKNMFRMAATDTQKDYCLGFLCHYSLDSTIHPYVTFVTEAYGSPFNIPSGHGYYEAALDSYLSSVEAGSNCADVDSYCPEIPVMDMEQICTLLKKAIDATYPEYTCPKDVYIKAFSDFRFIKKFFYSPTRALFPVAYVIEKALRFSEGFVMSHLQPCTRPLPSFSVWYNKAADLYSVETLDSILQRSDALSAESVMLGLEYFKGVYSEDDLIEDIGNKSYETGVVIDL